MSLHTKIKPHQHVSIWAIALLGVFVSIGQYNNAVIAASCDATGCSTASTFAPVKARTVTAAPIPAACLAAKHTAEDALTQIQTEKKDVEDQLNTLKKTVTQATAKPSGSTSSHSDSEDAATAATTQKISDLEKQDDALKVASTTALPTPPPAQTAACKQAVVTQEKQHLETYKSKIATSGLPALDKVTAAITKVEAIIPTLQTSGADPAVIQTITNDISTIKADIVSLRSYFQTVNTAIDQLDASGSDSGKAYDSVKKQVQSTDQAAILTKSDELKNALTDLQQNISALAK